MYFGHVPIKMFKMALFEKLEQHLAGTDVLHINSDEGKVYGLNFDLRLKLGPRFLSSLMETFMKNYSYQDHSFEGIVEEQDNGNFIVKSKTEITAAGFNFVCKDPDGTFQYVVSEVVGKNIKEVGK